MLFCITDPAELRVHETRLFEGEGANASPNSELVFLVF